MTGLPLDFRKWLVTVGTHEVTSHLNLLFIENGVPLTQDYITALSNYNLRTETDILREWAHQQVRNLVIELLFNKLSDTSNHVASFIHKYCDNISNSLLKEEACRLIHNTVQVSSLDVTVPRTKITTTVYNLYIHPPTVKTTPLTSWRQFIAGQRFYAGIYGVAVKYQYPWRCFHCKLIDHPAGLCHLVRNMRDRRETTNGAPPPEDNDLLPAPPEPAPGPSSRPQNPNHGKRANVKGKGIASGSQRGNRRPETPSKINSVRPAGPKKRKVN